MSSEINHLRQFGKFRLDVQKKVLWHEDRPVELPLKEIELLCVLTEKRGDVVTKNELLERVWSESFVEESNLSRHIYLLRKTFKDFGEAEDFIQTVPRRGYRFAGEVKEVANGDLIIEKHTLTQTLIEEINVADAVASSVFARSAETGRSLKQGLQPRILIPAALTVAIAVTGFFLLLNKRTDARGPGSITSIAVLPLKSLTENAEGNALSLGFADALITSLGRLDGIRVSSLGTAGHYADLRKESWEIGKDLGVDSVFDGTLQKANGKLRVTLRLIRTSDGKQMWSASFDENENDIFHLQDAMATQTARALALNLQLRDVKRPTENREAYKAYLRGRLFFDRRTQDDYDKAVAEFERAIALDENYALAYTGLADVYALKANDLYGKERDALYEKSRATATRALELDDSSAEGHTSLGWVKRVHDWDWTGSEREFRRALDLNPNSVNAHQWYALLLTTLGRTDEALEEIEKARDLEPLSTIVLQNYFSVRQYRGEMEMLPAVADQVANLNESPTAKARLYSAAYWRIRDYAKVIELDEAYVQSHGRETVPLYMAMHLGIAYGRIGQDSKAGEMIDYLRKKAKTNSEAAYRLSTVFSELGRTEESIKLLQTCLTAHDDRLVWIRVEPSFESLRSDTRFQALLRDLKLN